MAPTEARAALAWRESAPALSPSCTTAARRDRIVTSPDRAQQGKKERPMQAKNEIISNETDSRAENALIAPDATQNLVDLLNVEISELEEGAQPALMLPRCCIY
jgi:hypothetical protein